MRHSLAALALTVCLAPGASQATGEVPTAFQNAAAYSKRHAGRAVLVYRAGELVFEEYQNGHKREEAHHIFSGTKSFAPIVALIAQDEGLLTIDEKVATTLAEWRGDEKRELITIRHLLDFTSGLKNLDPLLHSTRAPDKYKAAIAAPGVHVPGTRFEYGSVHLMVFGEVLKRKLTARMTAATPKPAKPPLRQPRDFLDYLHLKVLDPIGCRAPRWIKDEERNPALPYGAFLTARDWARFGHLVLNKGRHGKRQIIPPKHLARCFEGTKANPVYGWNFWLVGRRYHKRLPTIPADTVAAAGMYKQKLYIVPSREMVVVRFGRIGARSKFREAEFLGRLFAE